MDWGMFALGVSAVLAPVWIWRLVKGGWAWPGLYASLGCLLAACFNSAAPFRGAIDPDYVGYAFGLARAEKGLAVTLIAAAIFIACAASAMIAAGRRAGPPLWVVAATCAVMAVIIGVPTVQGAISDPGANAIQFGEYLAIPGAVGTAILLLVLAIPFAVGAVWGARAAMRRPA
jgi:hypothetical protein